MARHLYSFSVFNEEGGGRDRQIWVACYPNAECQSINCGDIAGMLFGLQLSRVLGEKKYYVDGGISESHLQLHVACKFKKIWEWIFSGNAAGGWMS